MIRKGEEWGAPAGDAPPDLEVTGDDTALAAALAGAGPDPLVRFSPSADSDLARAVGLPGGTGQFAIPMDLLRVGDGGVAVNAVVVGVPPDGLRWWHRPIPVDVEVDGTALATFRATTVVVANGQFLRGFDVSPRGHPGDGWCEVQVYGVPPGQRGAMRARLRSGAHLPHPGITVKRARSVVVRCGREVGVEVDGKGAVKGVRRVSVSVVPASFRLLV